MRNGDDWFRLFIGGAPGGAERRRGDEGRAGLSCPERRRGNEGRAGLSCPARRRGDEGRAAVLRQRPGAGPREVSKKSGHRGNGMDDGVGLPPVSRYPADAECNLPEVLFRLGTPEFIGIILVV